MKLIIQKLFLFCIASAILYALFLVPKFVRLLSPRPYIRVLGWTDMINQRAIQQFQEETGCDVYISYVESNEELLGKMRLASETEYDLIVPSEHAVAVLKAEGKLLPLDKSRLEYARSRVHPRLRSGYYDKDMSYAVPYFWSIYGIGTKLTDDDAKLVTPARWQPLFENLVEGCCITLPNEPRELIGLAYAHLYGYEQKANEASAAAIMQLLKKTKKHVVAFTDLRPDYLLWSGSAQAAFVTTPFMLQCKRDNRPVRFTLPQEGTFMLIDLFAIPVGARVTHHLYDFINYVYRPDFVTEAFMETTFIPATEDVVELLKADGATGDLLRAYSDEQYPLYFYRTELSDKALGDLWLNVKSTP